MMRILRPITILFCTSVLIGAGVCPAASDPLSEQRGQFLDARTALKQGNTTRYQKLAENLRDYPLYPYLLYEKLRIGLSPASTRGVSSYLETYPDLVPAQRLRRSWLYMLARKRQWQKFLEFYREPQGVELQCYELQARLHTGQKQELMEDAIDLWLVGKSQPTACDPVFARLYKSELMTDELLWQRIRLAMANGKTSLAGYLAKQLPPEGQAQVKLWQDTHKRPAKMLKNKRLAKDTPFNRELIVHGTKRLARQDPENAWETWQSLKRRYEFTRQESGEVEREIGLIAAYRQHPDAHAWLSQVPETAVDERVRQWRIRTALMIDDWPAVVRHIRALTPEEQQEDEWRYWLTRGLENTNANGEARQRLSSLARERSFHGFLAADALEWKYEMQNEPLEFDEQELKDLGRHPAILRAHELYFAGLLIDARREWITLPEMLSDRELQMAAVLANRWGWHDRAIMTVAKTGHYSDLRLRFPLAHRELVEIHANKNNLDPGLVFGVIRQESAFMQDARSHAGAIGLMQLMPQTGKATASRYRIPLRNTRALYEAEKNIRIGSAYLNQVMTRFNGNMALAAAAYNAGPHRVQRWLPDENTKPASLWIANIPFSETRKYVQRVLAYATIYDWRLQRPVTTISNRMPAISPDKKS